MDADAALTGYAQKSLRLVSIAARFAAGSPVRHEETVRELHTIIHCLNGGLPGRSASVRLTARAAYALARGVLLATSELTARTDTGAGGDHAAAFMPAGEAIRASARFIDSALDEAIAGGDAYRLSAARQVDRDVVEAHRDAHPLGLPFDASESGPMGPLWPAGAPGWYRDCGHALRTRAQPAVRRAALAV
ncbi:MAG TPA: hypothetical protein VFL55_05990 [Acetobacteraceae bacterium]|nr:hypothetical protein [Acetobacteraceae bacterium]